MEVLAQRRKGAKFFGESPSPTIHPNPNPLFLCVFAPLREPPFPTLQDVCGSWGDAAVRSPVSNLPSSIPDPRSICSIARKQVAGCRSLGRNENGDQRIGPQSRSDPAKVAVGFNPRFTDERLLRRSATLDGAASDRIPPVSSVAPRPGKYA